MSTELISRAAEVRTAISQIPEGTPARQAADILTTALEEGRLTDRECSQILWAFTQSEAKTAEALRESTQTLEKYVAAVEKLGEVRYCAQQALAWLNDPLVKPAFMVSARLEMALNWLFRKGEPRP